MRRCQIARIGEQMTRPHRRRRVRGFAPSWIIYANTSSGLASSQRIVCTIFLGSLRISHNWGILRAATVESATSACMDLLWSARGRRVGRSVRQTRRRNGQKLVGPAGQWPRSIRGASPRGAVVHRRGLPASPPGPGLAAPRSRSVPGARGQRRERLPCKRPWARCESRSEPGSRWQARLPRQDGVACPGARSGGRRPGIGRVRGLSAHTIPAARERARSDRDRRQDQLLAEGMSSARGINASPGAHGRSAGGPVAALRARVEAVNVVAKTGWLIKTSGYDRRP